MRAVLASAASIGAAEYEALREERVRHRRAFLDSFESLDALLTPSSPALPLGFAALEARAARADTPSLQRWLAALAGEAPPPPVPPDLTRFTAPVNHLGLCAVSVPTKDVAAAPERESGWPTHLPCSVQVACREGEERLALRIAAAVERAAAGRRRPLPPLPRAS